VRCSEGSIVCGEVVLLKDCNVWTVCRIEQGVE